MKVQHQHEHVFTSIVDQSAMLAQIANLSDVTFLQNAFAGESCYLVLLPILPDAFIAIIAVCPLLRLVLKAELFKVRIFRLLPFQLKHRNII